jgi:hypothetical protein
MFLSDVQLDLAATGGIPPALKLQFKSLADDIHIVEQSKNVIMWKWEMPLRAINHHIGVLKTITLICSDKSAPQTGLFVALCRKYDKLRETEFYVLIRQNRHYALVEYSGPISAADGLDFYDMDVLSRGCWKMLKEFQRKRYREEEIVIDFTGGPKVTSVVAAAMTFNRRIQAQYVQTEDPWQVLSYEVVLASAETGRLGV